MKLRWFVVLLLAFASAGAVSKPSEKIQLVYRGQEGGPWKLYVFGTDCKAPSVVTVVQAQTDQPLIIECYTPRK